MITKGRNYRSDCLRMITKGRKNEDGQEENSTTKITTTEKGDELYEYMRCCSMPDRKCYTVPKRGPWWTQVVRVIHRCAKSLDVVFDEQVNDESRSNDEFWKQACGSEKDQDAIKDVAPKGCEDWCCRQGLNDREESPKLYFRRLGEEKQRI